MSEDVYRRLSRLAAERNKTINDLIEELLDNYGGGVSGDSIVEGLNEVRAMLRDCLDRLGARETKPIETKSSQTEPVPTETKNEVGEFGFEDNPWVQILRAKSRG